MAPSDIGDLAGELAQVSGWGITQDTDTQISSLLRAVNQTILDNVECQNEFGFGIWVYDTVVCLNGKTYQGGCNVSLSKEVKKIRESIKISIAILNCICREIVVVCLVVWRDNEPVLVGSVSYGSAKGCEQRYPSAFTRISSYADWIKNITQIEF